MKTTDRHGIQWLKTTEIRRRKHTIKTKPAHKTSSIKHLLYGAGSVFDLTGGGIFGGYGRRSISSTLRLDSLKVSRDFEATLLSRMSLVDKKRR